MPTKEHLLALEQAAFAAWPALETRDLGLWHLRYAEGYTKRANSANLRQSGNPLTLTQLEQIESFFAARSVPAIFRLPSFIAQEQDDHLLAAHGYQFTDVSLVLEQPMRREMIASHSEILTDAGEWLRAFQEISGKSDADQTTHLRMLQAIAHPCAFALRREHGIPVACGLGVVCGNYLGLFDIATSATARRRGLASQICEDLMAWGTLSGANCTYLQVLAGNTTAIQLYQKLGFLYRYHYWYRIQTMPDQLDI